MNLSTQVARALAHAAHCRAYAAADRALAAALETLGLPLESGDARVLGAAHERDGLAYERDAMGPAAWDAELRLAARGEIVASELGAHVPSIAPAAVARESAR